METIDWKVRKPVVCADGFTVSIQASRAHYCSPRITNAEKYTHCELGFPTEADDLIKEYVDSMGDEIDYTDAVYAFVPATVIRLLIAKHGGMTQGECPPLDINDGTPVGWEVYSKEEE
tara:strand:+ start:826 stop:1179 length:354 start_codon:yes stop_codon:yes gene_type:complete